LWQHGSPPIMGARYAVRCVPALIWVKSPAV
jgi:hypothetical protein